MSTVLCISDSASLALHAMALLARHPQARMSTAQMAETFGASEHTLGKVLHELVRAGFLTAVRGAKGGFKLARDASAITLLEVYETIEGPLEDSHCLLGTPACTSKHCVLGDLMNGLNAQVRDYFSRTTLQAFAHGVVIGDDKWPAVLTGTAREGSQTP